jgi:predicted N-acetyltransferase YhbS
MALSPIIVRPLASPAEYKLHFEFADQAFSPDPSPTSAQYWQQFVTNQPGFRPEQLRGAFRDGEQLGSYIMHERILRMGAAQFLTGCIGAVVTYPTYRHQGVATALMHDAIDYARLHNHALLLLDGIPKFYHRFGYIDMFDQSIHNIDCAAILAQPMGTHIVRPATPDDAESVLALYNHHYGPFTGSFLRTLEHQTYRLQHQSPDNPLWLAINPDGRPEGYLSLQSGIDRSQARELATDNWPSALALLRHHAMLLDGPAAPSTLRCRLPLTAPALQWMIDHLEVLDTSHWEHPTDEWVVRSQSFHHRDAGWMARLVHLPTLAQALLPEWQAHWRRSLSHWSGDVLLIVGEEQCLLRIDGTELLLVDQPASTTEAIQLTPQAFIQIVFGYRPVTYALDQHGQSIKGDLRSVLDILFPLDHTWIPASDWF